VWNLVADIEGGRRLRVFENRVLRRIFGARRVELRREWIKLHIEELNDLYCSTKYSSSDKIQRMSWASHVACMGERRNVYRVLVGET